MGADEPAVRSPDEAADQAAELAAGFVPMFNGTDFSGWQFDGSYALPNRAPENWSVADGVIRLSGGGRPNLGSQWNYVEFDMQFEWRSLRDKCNSNFFGRCVRLPISPFGAIP